jgi:glucan biosynthesis protein C
MSNPSTLTRQHSLDALRAAMMLLGLVIHSAVSYTVSPLGAAWLYKDGRTSELFDWVVFIIHLFRMPTFFAMAGFFAAFLYYREGTAGFIAHRLRRLLLPLVVGWLVIFPLIRAGFIYANGGGGSDGFASALGGLATTPYAQPSLAHLWFIYFLVIFCLAAVAVVPLVQRLPLTWRTTAVGAFGRYAPTLRGCLAFGAASAVTMIPMAKPALDTSLTFIPAARVLVAYSFFFSFGWLLFLRHDVVASFGRRPWRYVCAGLVAAVIYMLVVLRPPVADPTQAHLIAILAGGLAMWLLIYGVTGLFVRYCGCHRPFQRYLSDASYWMYIIHLPIVIGTQGLLAPVALPAVLKFAIVLSVTTLVTLTTYHFWVRSTAIGAFLNGRRLERAWPKLRPVVS